LQIADMAARPPDYKLLDSDGILGGPLVLSASRIEAFQRCHFRYYMRYMLGIEPLRRAEISPAEAGNFVHAVLENTLRQMGDRLNEADEKAVEDCVGQLADDYLREVLGPLALSDARVRYLVRRLRRQCVRLVLQIQKEQRQGLFQSADYELTISPSGDIPPLQLRTADGQQVSVDGKVDRVDVYERQGQTYIRIIDYKTGHQSFRLRDVFYGLSIQMLMYLFILVRNGQDRYPQPQPAGVLYLPSDPTLPTEAEDLGRTIDRAYRMDGLVIDDAEIIRAMERDIGGLFIPVTQKKDGSFSADKVASSERLGRIASHIDKTITDMAQALYDGNIEALPIEKDGTVACDYCDYAVVCRSDRITGRRIVKKLNENRLFQGEEETENSHGI